MPDSPHFHPQTLRQSHLLPLRLRARQSGHCARWSSSSPRLCRRFLPEPH